MRINTGCISQVAEKVGSQRSHPVSHLTQTNITGVTVLLVWVFFFPLDSTDSQFKKKKKKAESIALRYISQKDLPNIGAWTTHASQSIPKRLCVALLPQTCSQAESFQDP